MAGIVERAFSYQVDVTKSGSPRNLVSVVGFNVGDTKQIDLTTNTSGEFANVQEIIAQSYSVTLTDTVATTENNPFDLRFLKYEDQFFIFGKSFTGPSTDAVFLSNDDVITQSNQATVQGYTGITFTHGSTLITLSGGTWDPDRLYDRAKDEAELNPQALTAILIQSVDGTNFTQFYDILVQTISFDGAGAGYSGDWEVNNSASVTDLGVNNLILDDGTGTVQTTVTDVSVANNLTLGVATTYNFTRVDATDIINTSGGSITINASDSNLPVSPTGPNITIILDPATTKITVTDADGVPLENARVFVETADAGTGGAGLPYQNSVSTLTQTGGTATLVASAAHGLATNDYVVVRDANDELYNKQAQITVTNTTTFTYSVSASAAASAGGTPVFSYAPISGLTDVNGEIESSKVWPVSQSCSGWARKSSANVKQGNITILDASGGSDVQVSLQPDT